MQSPAQTNMRHVASCISATNKKELQKMRGTIGSILGIKGDRLQKLLMMESGFCRLGKRPARLLSRASSLQPSSRPLVALGLS